MTEYRQEQEIAKARADQPYTLEKAKSSQEMKKKGDAEVISLRGLAEAEAFEMYGQAAIMI